MDRAREVAGLAPGASVLEIGCGTGQLTRSLLARGLRVTAVEPGEELVARARDQLEGAEEAQFVNINGAASAAHLTVWAESTKAQTAAAITVSCHESARPSPCAVRVPTVAPAPEVQPIVVAS